MADKNVGVKVGTVQVGSTCIGLLFGQSVRILTYIEMPDVLPDQVNYVSVETIILIIILPRIIL